MPTHPDDLSFAREHLDAAIEAWSAHPICLDPTDTEFFPADMVEETDELEYYRWQSRPSTVTEEDLDEAGDELECELPSLLRALLCARAHLVDSAYSQSHQTQIMWPATPTVNPLAAFAGVVTGWLPLVRAGYLPFATWGDGWGPICLDLRVSVEPRDHPVVWFDHEELFRIGTINAANRDAVSALAKPLYPSLRALIGDAFSFPD